MLEQVEEAAIELDCEEVTEFTAEDGTKKYELTFGLSNLSSLESKLQQHGFVVESAEARLVSEHLVSVTSEEAEIVERFYTLVQEIEDVTNIFDNIEESEQAAVAQVVQ